ncbi:MAG: M48 family metallopeptidase [Opitutales bacterium]|nr:M48 family metallopeptidase [Opitutales bacterium]
MILTGLAFIAIALILLAFAASTWLDVLNAREVRANQGAVPEAFSGIIDEPGYFKSARYTLDKIKFGICERIFDTVLIVAVLIFGIYPMLFRLFSGAFGGGIWAQSLAFIFSAMVLGFASLPFDYYEQFKLEHKYGFNKSTVKLWVSDKIKEAAVSVLIAAPLLAFLLWLFSALPNTWWILGFCAGASFQLLMLIIYPRVILPLFNKLSELEDGELKTRLLNMADRAGFKASAIYVIDGSKRSSHSNAFFTGFGKFRKIVLFDTLINQLSPGEIEAVLAHEIGHYKCGHIPKMIIANFAAMFCGLAVVAYLAKCAGFYEGFGFAISDGMAAALIIFMIVASPVNFWFTPIKNAVSRKYEYQADAFAKRVCGGENSLIAALRKLHTKNLSNLTPHRIYSAFHYSHPTLLERERALRSGGEN